LSETFARGKRKASANNSGEDRLKRVFFLTDMESSTEDEEGVIAIAQQYAAIRNLNKEEVQEEAKEESTSQKRKSRRFSAKQQIPEDEKLIAKEENVRYSVNGAPTHLTLLGIGVDLSAGTIDKLSCIPGAKYISVINASEFTGITRDFDFDVTPVALDIQVHFPPELSIVKGFGSSELNSLAEDSKVARLSSEFPVSKEESGEMFGGIYLFQLKENHNSSNPVLLSEVKVRVSWFDRYYREQKVGLVIPVVAETLSSGYHLTQTNSSPSATTSSSSTVSSSSISSNDFGDKGLPKSVALLKYVQALTDYAFDSSLTENHPSDHNSKSNNNGFTKGQQFPTPTKKQLNLQEVVSLLEDNSPLMESIIAWDLEALFQSASSMKELQSLLLIPLHEDTYKELKNQFFYGLKFSHLKKYLFYELSTCCGDTSLSSTNMNIIQTIDQVIQFAKDEISKFMKEVQEKLQQKMILLNLNKSSDGVTARTGKSNVGKGREKGKGNNAKEKENNQMKAFLCPITMAIMSDPVVAADGHSNERKAIEEWLQHHDTSPCTNDLLPNKYLTSNFTMKSLIQDFSSSKKYIK
jgi:hypothetical protein